MCVTPSRLQGNVGVACWAGANSVDLGPSCCRKRPMSKVSCFVTTMGDPW